MQRLDFKLPAFVRLSWVSDQARQVWAPRMDQVRRRWPNIERLSVKGGLRRCSSLQIHQGEYEYMQQEAELSGLTCLVLTGDDQHLSVVFGREGDATQFQEAWQAKDHETMGSLLGYPPCCIDAYLNDYIMNGWDDFNWPVAQATAKSTSNEYYREITPTPYNTILLRRLGFYAVPHYPCSFYCEATGKQSDAYLDLGCQLGYAEDMEQLRHILKWPVSWSSLHGIAELKTPLFKASMDTDAWTHKYEIHFRGTEYPEAGAQGIVFPYEMPKRHSITDSRSFHKGLANPLSLTDET